MSHDPTDGGVVGKWRGQFGCHRNIEDWKTIHMCLICGAFGENIMLEISKTEKSIGVESYHVQVFLYLEGCPQ